MADKVVSLKVVVDTATGTANVENLNEELKGTVEATEQTGKQSKKVTTDMSNGFKMVGDAIGKANPMLGGLISGINMATKASWSFIATPLGIALAAIAAAGLALFQAFKTFQPLLDKIEQSFAAVSAVVGTVRNAFIAMVTGNKSLGDAFRGLGGDMKEASVRARELKKAEQELNGELKIQEVATAKSRAIINALNTAAKDRTKSETERIELLKLASTAEKLDYDERKKLADKELELAKRAIIIKAKLKDQELLDFEELGVAYQQYSEKKGGSQDKLYLKLKDAILKGIELEEEATANQLNNIIKQNQLIDDQKAKRDQDTADQKAAAEKRAADKIEAARKEQEAIEKLRNKYTENEAKIAARLKFIEDNTIAVKKQGTDTQIKLQQQTEKAINELPKLAMSTAVIISKVQNTLVENIDIWYGKNEKAIKQTLKMTSDGLGALADLLESSSAKGEVEAKKQFERVKKLRIAQAIVDTIMGAQSAYADTIGGPVVKGIAAAIATVSGLARVKAIKNTKYDGGSVPTPSTDSSSTLSGGTQSQSTGLTPLTPQSVRGRKDSEPVKVFVTETDIRAASGRVSDIQSKAVVK
jgi:hypothetical protein